MGIDAARLLNILLLLVGFPMALTLYHNTKALPPFTNLSAERLREGYEWLGVCLLVLTGGGVLVYSTLMILGCGMTIIPAYWQFVAYLLLDVALYKMTMRR